MAFALRPRPALRSLRLSRTVPTPSPFPVRTTASPRRWASGTDAVVVVAVPPPPVRRSRVRTVLRWSWRLSYLSVIGLVGLVSYNIYLDHNPPPQEEPDPSKKTLVILGTGWGSVSLLKNLDTEHYNVVVVSPRNYFLFTPLLPSCTTGTVEHRSIMEPIRSILRHKRRVARFYEAEATAVDLDRKVVTMRSVSDLQDPPSTVEVAYDLLAIGVGAENATFGIPGVREHACFLKEIGDAQAIRRRIMDCVEIAALKGQTPAEIDRLLHMVVVGGGPTGVEFAAELHDFFEQDIKKLIPDIQDRFRVSLIEALPSVLPSFSRQLIDYTEATFRASKIDVLTKTTVNRVTDRTVEAVHARPDGPASPIAIPYGLLVWATGNGIRPLIRDLIAAIPAQAGSRRGLAVNDFLVVRGARDVWALGDCAVAGYAPTAQVASQEGVFLARLFNNMAQADHLDQTLAQLTAPSSPSPSPADAAPASAPGTSTTSPEADKLERQVRRLRVVKPFKYSHQGSLAYIGSDKAVADISWWDGNLASAGSITYLFWRSAYLSMCFSTRNRLLVINDWFKSKTFGRDISRE